MVLSADLNSVLINEGMIYDGLTAKEIAQRTNESKQQIKPGRIKARTSRGVRLGMTQAEVRKILGTPKRSFYSKRFRAQELVYGRSKIYKDGTGESWTNYYLFRGGKLYYVELREDAVGEA